jgi:hypothetical protein
MTIPDIGHCAGSGAQPLEGTLHGGGDQRTGVCGACSGRFDLRSDGTVSFHDAAEIDDREVHSPQVDATREL